MTAELAEKRIGEEGGAPIGQSVVGAPRLSVAEQNKLLRIVNGEIAKHQYIEQAENRGIGADAERQSQNGDDGEGWSFPQLARGVAQVARNVAVEGVLSLFRLRRPRRSKSQSKLIRQFRPGPRAFGDLSPGIVGAQAAAQGALVVFFKLKRQLLNDFGLALARQTERGKIFTNVGSEIRHFRDLRPFGARREMHSSSGVARLASYDLHE